MGAQVGLFVATVLLAYGFVIVMGLASPPEWPWEKSPSEREPACPQLIALLTGEIPDSSLVVVGEMGPDPGNPAALEASIQWLAVAVADGVLAVAFLVLALSLTWRAVVGLGPRWRRSFVAIGTVLPCIPIYFIWHRLLSSRSLLALLVAAHFESSPFESGYVGFLDGAAIACAIAMVLACAAQCLLPREGRWTPALLRERLRALQYLLFSGATLLTLGVFEVWSLYRWLLMPWESRGDHALDAASAAARVGIGAASSIALLIAYLPANLYLRAVARRLAADRLAGGREQDDWLSSQGLDGSGWEPLTRLATALSPALVSGPLAALVHVISK